jgi:hypothetical protein
MTLRDPTDIAGAEQAKRQEARRAKNLRLTELADIKWLMESKQGRRFMWRLFSRTGIYLTSFSTNGMQMAYREGERSVGLDFLADVHLECPDAHNLMTKENSSVRRPIDERPNEQ